MSHSSAAEGHRAPAGASIDFSALLRGTVVRELPNWTLVQDKSPPKESPVTVHVCGECGMDFPQKQQLEEYCQKCGKSCVTADLLKKHELKPTAPALMACSLLPTQRAPQDSGERPYLCSICGKDYSKTSHLEVHLRVHEINRIL
ncbi:hypothetical protein FQN60_012420, partial [Etheostoma spectabile]